MENFGYCAKKETILVSMATLSVITPEWFSCTSLSRSNFFISISASSLERSAFLESVICYKPFDCFFLISIHVFLSYCDQDLGYINVIFDTLTFV